MVKKAIRKYFGEKRLQLSTPELEDHSSAMLELYRTLNFAGSQWLLSYQPIVARNEFNVALCEQLHTLQTPDAAVAWPKLQADGITMDAIIVTRFTVLAQNKYGIFEPAEGEIIDPQMIDLVYVPLLAFDTRGYRVGYGKGFYDRFLARCAQDVVKVGFSYFDAVDEIEDIDQFDVPLSYCVTPSRVYEF